MDGVFVKRRFATVYNIIGFISGVFLVLLFSVFLSIGAYSTLDDIILSLFFVCFGALVSILCSISLYVDRKAYIRVDAQKISAFCHFGLSLECDLSEVGRVSYRGTQLSIQLKNGKIYHLYNLDNAYQVRKYIQKQIFVEPAIVPDKEELIAAIPSLKNQRKYEGITAISSFLLLFPGILLTSGLTGGKELHEFNSNDWVVFAGMAGLGITAIGIAIIMLRKYLSHTDELQKIQGTLYQIVLLTAPVQPGNVIKLFLDDEIYASIRLTVYGYPNSDEVYYIIEQVNQLYEIECIYKSKIFANICEIAPDIEDMNEIPLPQE